MRLVRLFHVGSFLVSPALAGALALFVSGCGEPGADTKPSVAPAVSQQQLDAERAAREKMATPKK